MSNHRQFHDDLSSDTRIQVYFIERPNNRNYRHQLHTPIHLRFIYSGFHITAATEVQLLQNENEDLRTKLEKSERQNRQLEKRAKGLCLLFVIMYAFTILTELFTMTVRIKHTCSQSKF
jgi:hypothetical protein